ncbi:amidase domain-containing protein [Paenibacillus sp. Y412MC10]|uniref:amidase domain-containing protein n=1 Tax=Geobacillus sp. (strain Y412MC10) TaxID=481743 RepID=UPI0011AB632F|nr:amidase domain-containing protein [Paenibacillus sp. Y412MC10]
MNFKKILMTGILATSMLPLSIGGNAEAATNSVADPEGVITSFLNTRENKIENINSNVRMATTSSSPDLDYLYDEALNLIRVMEETTGRTLKDYSTVFNQTSSESIGDTTTITGELTQTIVWENSEPEDDTVLKDTVTFTVSNNTQTVTKSTLPKSEVAGDELVQKSKANLEKYSNESGAEAQMAQEKAYAEHAGLDTTRKEPEVRALASYTFNRTNVKAYALTYAINNNSQYWTFENDCTNFASQSLNAGGIPKQKIQEPYENFPNWWMNTGAAGEWLYAVPWVQADSFFKLIRSTDTIHGYSKPGPSYLYEGDILSYDKGSDYTMNHTAVVTNTDTPSTPLVSYHTTNRKNVPWDFYINNTSGSVVPYFTHIL